MNLENTDRYWQKWVLKPEQEKYRGKEITLLEMWEFAESYKEEETEDLKDALRDAVELIRVCHNILSVNSLHCPDKGLNKIKQVAKPSK